MQTDFSYDSWNPATYQTAVWKCLMWPSHIGSSDSVKPSKKCFSCCATSANIHFSSFYLNAPDASRCGLLIVQNRGVHQGKLQVRLWLEEWWWVSQCGKDAAARSKALSVDNLNWEQKQAQRGADGSSAVFTMATGKVLKTTGAFPLLCSEASDLSHLRKAEKAPAWTKVLRDAEACTDKEDRITFNLLKL